MSGYMKYPYRACRDCPHFNSDESADLVMEPNQTCEFDHEDDCLRGKIFDDFSDNDSDDN